MYSSYSQFQQFQLAKQPYQDTQQIWLSVYAPGRCSALSCSLELQLHRKFRLIRSLDSLPEGLDGVVLAAEDVECLSTTLSYFAAALQSGADLAFCDAVFGFEGDTVVYRAAQRPEGAHCAVLSRELLLRCRAQARDPDDPASLLRLAFDLAQKPVHIPQALLRYRRQPAAADLFSDKGKRALLLSHVLDMTGAPIVLVSAVPVLRQMGYEVAVLGPGDGGSLSLFVEAGATAITHPDCVSSSMLWGLATAVDLVVANTIVEVKAIRALNGAPVPVLWWLHDAFVGYGYLSHLIPRTLESNIRVCAVGSHATAAMHEHRPNFAIGQLIYGLPDYAQDTFEPYDISYAGGLPLLVSVGAFELRKGQDILVQAIRMLPDAIRAKAAFLFVGKGADKRLLAEVQQLVADYPANVFYVSRLTRSEIKSLMDQCACTVCSSRDDPMPTFVTEGLIFGKPGIVSEHTGTAGLITEGVDGFVYHNDSPAELVEAMAKLIEHPGLSARMAPACRALYQRYYSKEAFANTLREQVEALLQQAVPTLL